jgi:hypothetical protein
MKSLSFLQWVEVHKSLTHPGQPECTCTGSTLVWLYRGYLRARLSRGTGPPGVSSDPAAATPTVKITAGPAVDARYNFGMSEEKNRFVVDDDEAKGVVKIAYADREDKHNDPLGADHGAALFSDDEIAAMEDMHAAEKKKKKK